MKFLYESPIIINLGIKIFTKTKKEVKWDISKVAAVDTAEGRERCTRRFAQNVRKNAKSLLNPEMTVRYTARIAIQSARTKVVKRRDFVSLFL
ncbi:MAG: hypothetical protein AMJ78_06250, partial [Omnitrophica WOR_2 bacterium SM23_29]